MFHLCYLPIFLRVSVRYVYLQTVSIVSREFLVFTAILEAQLPRDTFFIAFPGIHYVPRPNILAKSIVPDTCLNRRHLKFA